MPYELWIKSLTIDLVSYLCRDGGGNVPVDGKVGGSNSGATRNIYFASSSVFRRAQESVYSTCVRTFARPGESWRASLGSYAEFNRAIKTKPKALTRGGGGDHGGISWSSPLHFSVVRRSRFVEGSFGIPACVAGCCTNIYCSVLEMSRGSKRDARVHVFRWMG